MADKCVIFFSDNAAVVDIINKQTSKDSAIMVLLRDLVLSCLRPNILFQARHIPGFNNSRADYLSRSQVTKFQQLTLQYQRTYCRGIGFYFEQLAQYVADRWLTSTVSESMVRFSRILCSVLWFGKPFFAAFSILYSAFYFISFFSETSFFYDHFLSSGHFVCTN